MAPSKFFVPRGMTQKSELIVPWFHSRSTDTPSSRIFWIRPL